MAIRTVISAVDESPGSRLVVKGEFVDEDLGVKAPFAETFGVGVTLATIQAELRRLRAGSVTSKDVVAQIPIGDFDLDQTTDHKELFGEKLLQYRRLQGVAAFGIDVSTELDTLKQELIADFLPEYSEFFMGILK